MLLARFRLPLVENPPVATMLPVAFLVTVPEFVKLVAPLEVQPLFSAKFVPVRLAVPTFTVPVNVLVPVPADCVRPVDRSTALEKVALFAEVIVRLSSSVAFALLPTVPVKITLPAPATTVRLSATPAVVPLVLPVTVTAPPPELSVGLAASAITRLPPMESAVPTVVMLLARFTLPLVLKPPSVAMLPVELFVKVPELVTDTAPGDVKLFCTL